MRRKHIVLVALAVGLLVLPPTEASHETSGSNPPNERPVARAGPDQVVQESAVFIVDGVDSYDPDPDDDEDLEYWWNITQWPTRLIPNQTSGLDPAEIPIALQVAKKCIIDDQMGIDLEDWQAAYHGSYMEPGVPTDITYVLTLTVFDRDPEEVVAMYPPGKPLDSDGDGDFDDEDGDGEPDHPRGWTGKFVDDNGTRSDERNTTNYPEWYTEEQNETARANQTNHMSTDDVRIKVLNTNQAPHGEDDAGLGCEDPVWLDLEIGVVQEDGSVINDDEVDMWEDRKKKLQLTMYGFDDKGIAVVEAYFYHEDDVAEWEKSTKDEFLCQADALEERLRVSLGRLPDFPVPGAGTSHPPRAPSPPTPDPFGPDLDDPGSKEDYAKQIYRGQTNRTMEPRDGWRAVVPVSTPALVEGSYRICVRAFDKEGGVGLTDPDQGEVTFSTSIDKDQSPPCLSILAPGVKRAITPDVPEELPPDPPIKDFKCSYPPQPPDDTCSVFPEQFLGAGRVVRLDVQIIPFGIPGDEDYEPNTTLLLDHVTVRNEFLSLNGSLLSGPEALLEDPYIIDLDSLALSTRRLHVEAHDRAGGVAEICLKVTPDPLRPEVLASIPETVYVDVNSTWNFYIQDKVHAVNTLRVQGMDIQAETSTGSDHITETRTNETLVVLPALAAYPQVDMNGDGINDVVFDSRAVDDTSLNNDPAARIYDAYWDFVDERLHGLQQAKCDDDKILDHFEDLDGDGKCGDDEPWVKALPVAFDGVAPIDGLAPTPEQQGTNVTQDVLDALGHGRVYLRGAEGAGAPSTADLVATVMTGRTYVLAHEVRPDAVQPLRVYDWTATTRDQAENVRNMFGKVELGRAYVDTAVTNLTAVSDVRGLLPGDPAVIQGNLSIVDGLPGIEYEISFAFGDDPYVDFTGDPDTDDGIYALLLADGRIRTAQCRDTAAGSSEPCRLRTGESHSINMTEQYPPGRHEIALQARAPPQVEERDPSDNRLVMELEVFLGRSDVGGTSYFIRADERGLPKLQGGAIDLETNATYDLRLVNATEYSGPGGGERPLYVFNVSGKTYYWDPAARYDDGESKTCEPATRPGELYDTRCRPITKAKAITPVVPERDETTPGVGPAMALALLGAALWVARRR